MIIFVLLGVLALSVGRKVDETPHSPKLLSLGRMRRHMQELAAKKKQIDPEDEDYAVDKGEEHKETIAQVSVLF